MMVVKSIFAEEEIDTSRVSLRTKQSRVLTIHRGKVFENIVEEGGIRDFSCKARLSTFSGVKFYCGLNLDPVFGVGK